MYYSSDGGATWSAAGGTSGSFLHLAAGPDGALFAGTAANGVWSSTDAGASWAAINDGLGNLSATSLAVDFEGNLFVATATGLYTASAAGAWHWGQVTGIPTPSISAIAFNDDDALLAAGAGGVYLSTDAGKSWTAQNTGLPGIPVTHIAPGKGSKFYVATSGRGVWISTPTYTRVATSNWLNVGALHDWISNLGCEIEVGRSSSADKRPDRRRLS